MTFFAATSDVLSNPFWIESDAASLLYAGLFVLAGLFLGYALRSLVGRWQTDAIEKRMQLKAEEAEADLVARRQEADVAARAAVVKAREDFEKSVQKRRDDQLAAETMLAERAKKADDREARLDAREAVLKANVVETQRLRQELDDRVREADASLQRIARLTHLEARKEIIAQTHAALREDAASMSRRIQEAAREQGEAIARDTILQAIQRCAVSGIDSFTTVAVAIPGAEIKGRIVGRDGRNVRTFESLTGVTIILDDAPDTVVLSSFDPLRRAIARRALELLVADGRIHPASIEEAVRKARAEVEAGNAAAATAAAAACGVTGLPTEVLEQMGLLRFRTSFSQNVLQHAVETALIAGTLADETGRDATLARRIGFLHDIGKAATSGKRGAHARLGADFLKAQGENATVVSAVAAHHGDEGTDGGPYGILCAVADAISSARPGARQETVGTYVERLETVEKIARSHAGVTDVVAVQAGRELRVLVDPKAVTDDAAQVLAQAVCREISQNVRFPGMIRVTVIRETRCVEYAK